MSCEGAAAAFKVVAIERENIERIELDFLVMPAGYKAVEVADAIDTKQHGFAVQYELLRADA